MMEREEVDKRRRRVGWRRRLRREKARGREEVEEVKEGRRRKRRKLKREDEGRRFRREGDGKGNSKDQYSFQSNIFRK